MTRKPPPGFDQPSLFDLLDAQLAEPPPVPTRRPGAGPPKYRGCLRSVRGNWVCVVEGDTVEECKEALLRYECDRNWTNWVVMEMGKSPRRES